ncbi:MAG: hypothetical protein WCR73_05050 [Acholeplasmataceae bacterium]
MKIILFCLLTLSLCMVIPFISHASSNYKSYESLTMEDGQLLSDFTDEDYKNYYDKVSKRKFIGWQIYEVNRDSKVYYITETLFSYHNDGYTAIDYTYKYTKKETKKIALSATGSIGFKSTGDKQGFKNNLDGSLKLSSDYTNTKEESETYEIKLKVDPGTRVDLYIYGEGKITNGVAAFYWGFIRTMRGGYEIFLVTTQYQRLEKVRI